MNSVFNDAIYLDDIPKEEWSNYIGNGYRYVSYLTDESRRGKIVLFGYDKTGGRKTFICPWQSYIKYNVKYQTNEKDLYGNYVATKWFKSSYERKKYIENAAGLSIVEALKPEYEFLHFMFDKEVLKDDFNKQKLRIFSLDIETEISDTFMPPALAENRINMITIHDNETDMFYTWSLEHADVDFKEEPLDKMPKSKFKFFEFHNNETLMLEHFLDWWEDNCPDVIYGWNIRAYDTPYIIRRIENVLGKNAAQRLSPVKKYMIKEVNHENSRANAEATIEVSIQGVSQLDGLVLYRDKFKIKAALDGGYGLSNVGETENLGHKIAYEGTLKDLYIQDYQKFYEYNVRDVDLCKRIDDKCKMIQLARQITSFGLNNYETIYSSISYLVGSLIAYARSEMDGVIFNSYMAAKQQFSSFEGAYVFPTNEGVYDGGIATIDFASLYPSTIRSVNLSPETLVGKVIIYKRDSTGAITCNVDNDEPFDIWNDNVVKNPSIVKLELKTKNGQRKAITIEQIKDLVNTKCIWTRNNTLFLKHEVKTGSIPLWCKHFYTLRKSYKKKMFAAENELFENKSLTNEERKKLEVDKENYDMFQLGVKIMLNSVYGMLGTAFSPIANVDIAQTVTRQGRFANVTTSEYIISMLKEQFGIDDKYVTVAYSDTDSLGLNTKCITDKWSNERNLPKKLIDWSPEDKKKLWDFMFNLVEEKINPFVRNLIHVYCKTTQQDVLTYELEYMASVGLFESKKHYAVRHMFDDGHAVDYMKYSGIELKKAIVPKKVKGFLQEIYEGVIKHSWTERDYQDYIEDLYSRFKQFSVDDIALWKGYNTEREATGFLTMALGTTGIAKSCAYYNQLISHLGLGKKYEQIRVGNKVRMTYLEPTNKFGINCIAYLPDQWPKEFDEIFKIDYHLMFEKIILDPLKNFRKACKFEDHDPSKQIYSDDLDSL